MSDAVIATAQTGTGFLESQTSIDDRLFLNVGGRFEAHNQYGEHGTFQTGLSYRVPGLETRLKVNYGTAFLAPSLYQLYNPNYGNKSLSPETNTGFDLGFEQAFGKDLLMVGATYFDNDFSNLIDFYTDPMTYISYYVNVGKARTYGVESFLVFKGLEHMDVRFNYTYTSAMNTIKNTELIRRPQNKAGLDANYQLGAAEFGATVSYTGTRVDSDFSFNRIVLPSYFLVSLRASCQLGPRVRIFARVENLFDQAYEESFGYGTPGFSAYGGTKVSF
jgi:vitamin B12 transporter